MCNVLANGNAQLNLYTQRGDVLDFGVEQGLGQAIVGDAVAERAPPSLARCSYTVTE